MKEFDKAYKVNCKGCKEPMLFYRTLCQNCINKYTTKLTKLIIERRIVLIKKDNTEG